MYCASQLRMHCRPGLRLQEASDAVTKLKELVSLEPLAWTAEKESGADDKRPPDVSDVSKVIAECVTKLTYLTHQNHESGDVSNMPEDDLRSRVTLTMETSKNDGLFGIARTDDGNARPPLGNLPRNAREHWQSCSSCKEEFPYALPTLDHIRSGLLLEIKRTLEKIRHEFLSSEHQILANHPEEEQKKYASILVNLAGKAWDIVWDLGFVSEVPSSGIADFSIFADDSDSERVRKDSADFIRGLDTDLQLFLFTAVLSQELLGGMLTVAMEKAREPLDAAVDTPVESSTRDNGVCESLCDTVDFRVFYNVIKTAAGVYLHEYLSNNPKRATARDPERDTELYYIASVQAVLEDFRQEVRAGIHNLSIQVQQLYQAEPDAASFIPLLKTELGECLYERLDTTTKRALQLAELAYSRNKEPDAFGPIVVHYATAYENEIYLRVAVPLAKELAALGFKDYPPKDAVGEAKLPLLQSGELTKTSLGQVNWYLRKDECIKKLLNKQGLDAQLISRGIQIVSEIRNSSGAHRPLATREPAERLRGWLIGKRSIFRDLFPKTDS